MVLLRRLLLVAVLLSATTCSENAGDSGGEESDIPVSELLFEGSLAMPVYQEDEYLPAGGVRIYGLIGMGFFRSPTSTTIDEFIRDWLSSHPDARAVVVSEIAMTDSDPSPMLAWIWVRDGEENLNLQLVRFGHCAGGTMHAPEEKILVTRQVYDRFLAGVEVAERQAKAEELGIWADEQE